MNFKDIYQIQKGTKTPEQYVDSNEKLTKAELIKVRNIIAEMQEKGVNSEKIIKTLQLMNTKLMLKWKAERAYWTETKRLDTNNIVDAGDNLDIEEYKVILSPNACEVCRSKSENGKKIFKTSDFEKSGYGHVPPFHPGCYCVTIPN